ncbi:AAA family ATPase [Geobacter argillaceus]|uniref:AAA family ATPase n=1 Tax=Geobacter argillaceus TaxID=345631 RepID=UPI00119EC746|nr:AAA family ATPase [Geobacter argillaceus]
MYHGGDFGAAARELARQGYGEKAPEPAIVGNQEPGTKPSLFMSAGDFLDTHISINHLIKPFIERDTTGLLFGPSGCGKTFTVLDCGLAVAVGGEPITENGTRDITGTCPGLVRG